MLTLTSVRKAYTERLSRTVRPPAFGRWEALPGISHTTWLQVAREIWEVKGGRVNIWPDDIVSYKRHLAKQVAAMLAK